MCSLTLSLGHKIVEFYPPLRGPEVVLGLEGGEVPLEGKPPGRGLSSEELTVAQANLVWRVIARSGFLYNSLSVYKPGNDGQEWTRPAHCYVSVRLWAGGKSVGGLSVSVCDCGVLGKV